MSDLGEAKEKEAVKPLCIVSFIQMGLDSLQVGCHDATGVYSTNVANET